MKVQILHNWRKEFRVVAIDLIPECKDEERILEAFNGVEAGTSDRSPILQLCLLNKTTDPCTTQKSARNTAAKSAGNCDKDVDLLIDRLFSTGAGSEADRLVLTTKDGRDLGGWCKDAIRSEIQTALSRILREVKP